MSVTEQKPREGWFSQLLMAAAGGAVVWAGTVFGLHAYEEQVAVQGIRLALEAQVSGVNQQAADSVKSIDELWQMYAASGLERADFDRVSQPVIDSHFTLLPELIAGLAAILIFFTVNLLVMNWRRNRRYQALVDEHQQSLEMSREQIEQASGKDPVTGLVNASQFEILLDIECRRAVREFTPLSLILLEPDSEYLNDLPEEDHPVMAQLLAKNLQQTVFRPGDVIARISDYRFALLLPATNEQSPQLAERLRQQATEIVLGGQPMLLSLGVSTMQPSAQLSAAHIQQLTEDLLQQAQNNGGNQVSFNTEQSLEVPVTYSD
ncbi:GGDEF domain-containing protein [Aliamphritea spongicola]|uniref:GGDEF domain-containing protein n=1 Tax=Aliamphritea spongicola TaxID=707589 RepID=UPI00196B1D87|nr:GGDEF domain-containing protein [Aliamphritea spongicola]MBN3561792.1 GGDEF domain-containing protein [Aliamphritea spongicola]